MLNRTHALFETAVFQLSPGKILRGCGVITTMRAGAADDGDVVPVNFRSDTGVMFIDAERAQAESRIKRNARRDIKFMRA